MSLPLSHFWATDSSIASNEGSNCYLYSHLFLVTSCLLYQHVLFDKARSSMLYHGVVILWMLSCCHSSDLSILSALLPQEGRPLWFVSLPYSSLILHSMCLVLPLLGSVPWIYCRSHYIAATLPTIPPCAHAFASATQKLLLYCEVLDTCVYTWLKANVLWSVFVFDSTGNVFCPGSRALWILENPGPPNFCEKPEKLEKRNVDFKIKYFW